MPGEMPPEKAAQWKKEMINSAIYWRVTSNERVGEWGLVKKMSVPAHDLQSFDRINTFLARI
jgi:hypothetical protein